MDFFWQRGGWDFFVSPCELQTQWTKWMSWCFLSGCYYVASILSDGWTEVNRRLFCMPPCCDGLTYWGRRSFRWSSKVLRLGTSIQTKVHSWSDHILGYINSDFIWIKKILYLLWVMQLCIIIWEGQQFNSTININIQRNCILMIWTCSAVQMNNSNKLQVKKCSNNILTKCPALLVTRNIVIWRFLYYSNFDLAADYFLN